MLTQLPSATYTELDQSTVPPAQLSDYHGLITPTLFGPSDQPYLITTVDAFNAQFGANGAGNPFYASIKRALARGAAFYIQRLVATGATEATVVLGASEVSVTAKWAGTYANGNLSVQYTPISVGITEVILAVNYGPNSLLNEIWTAATYTALVAVVNANSKLVTMSLGTTPTEPVSSVGAPIYLAAGSDGAFSSPTLRATAANALLPNFNNLTNLTTIGILGGYTAGDHSNILAYASGRGDVFAIGELDPSLTPANALTAAAALAIPVGSSYLALYWGSYIQAWSPDDGATVSTPALPDIMAVYSYSDTAAGNQYEAPAGSTRGLIPNVSGFAYNMMSQANSPDANALVALGINIIGLHKTYGPVVWGAGTMNQKNSAMDAINVRRMMIWLRDQLQPIYDGELFEPMNPQSWLTAYNQIKPILQQLVSGQAISQWSYIGDQNASTIAGATYNTAANLANGQYKALINLWPTGYISSIQFTAEVNNLLSLFQSSN